MKTNVTVTEASVTLTHCSEKVNTALKVCQKAKYSLTVHIQWQCLNARITYRLDSL